MPRGVSPVDEAMVQRRLWTPALLRPSVWLDAADVSTISISTGVSEWRGKSGFGGLVSQGTSGNQPAYTVGGLNGLNVLTFDGTNDSLENTTYVLPTVYSVYAIGRSSVAGYSRLFTGGLTDIYAYIGTGPTTSDYATFFGNGTAWNDVAVNTPARSIASTCIMGLVKANSVGGAIPYVNGIAQDVKNGTTTTVTGFILGRAASNVQFWNGIVAEIIIQPALSTTGERQKFEGYLAHKWGLQNLLPAAHPFKNKPPLIGD
jgi:hypothetical protein